MNSVVSKKSPSNGKPKKAKLPLNPELDSDFKNFPMIYDYDNYMQQKQKDILEFEDKLVVDSSIIKSKLQPHQTVAFRWLLEHEYLHKFDPKKYESSCAILVSNHVITQAPLVLWDK